MLILKNPAIAETKVKNSRFVAELRPVQSAQEAKALWRFCKDTYDNGGHIVYAFAIGPQQNVCGCSDDGEPSGTAGRPVLAVLKGSGLTNALLTVARYFGGTKLGTGGLVHAYSDAAHAVLEAAEFRELIPMFTCRITLPYALYSPVAVKLDAIGFEKTGESFGAEIELSGRIDASRQEELTLLLQESGNGKINITELAGE